MDAVKILEIVLATGCLINYGYINFLTPRTEENYAKATRSLAWAAYWAALVAM